MRNQDYKWKELVKELKTKQKKNKTKQKGGLFSMLLGTLAASILRNALAGKGVIRAV